jgi:general secretion pathway protein D
MVRAKQALKEGDLRTADALISQAETFNVSYSVFHFGDTPKKLRAQLNAAKRPTKNEKPSRPSDKFEPELPDPTKSYNGESSTGDAATGKLPTESLDPAQEGELQIPASDGRLGKLLSPQRSEATPDDEISPETTVPAPQAKPAVAAVPAARQGNPHLLAARKALAVGDVRRATAALELAKQTPTEYGLHDDTPDKVSGAITEYTNAMELLNAQQNSEAARHQLSGVLLDQAQQLVRWNDLDEAERLTHSIQSLQVNYGPFELKPEAVLEKIAAARSGKPLPQDQAANESKPYPAAQTLFDKNRDTTQNKMASGDEPAPGPDIESPPDEPVERLPEPEETARPIVSPAGNAMELFRQGEAALSAHDMNKAMEYFRQAYAARNQLDPAAAQKLQDHMQMLAAPREGQSPAEAVDKLLDRTAENQQLLAKQLLAEIAQKQIKANNLREKDPKGAMALLKEAKASVESSGLDPALRAQLVRRVDRTIEDLDKYIVQNKAQIELDEANKAVLDEVKRRQDTKIEVDEKLAELVEQFNKLMDEERWAEAEVLAKRARELAPQNPLVRQLMWQSRFAIRTMKNQDLKDAKEDGNWQQWNSLEESAVGFNDNEPYRMPDAKTWEQLTKSRKQLEAEGRTRLTERELEIERKLKTPVLLKFRDTPLSEVLNHLATLASVNLHLDEKGLEEEGVSSDTPVTIDLTHEISLKSALHLILEPKHLSYVIQNEVLKITSEQLRDGVVYSRTYQVADLVIPIPNFIPNGRTGLPGALAEGYGMAGGAWGGMGGVNGVGTGYLASHDGSQATGIIDPKVLAQINQMTPAMTGAQLGSGGSVERSGPGGMGGGAQADFDTLIELITTTVKPQTWDEVGGPGSISEFPNNLSLVISQTQDVHEEIVDLLEQLRRNQDLQVTVEVRFITLNDNFFEQIGVDFQASIVNDAFGKVDPNSPGVVDAIVGLNPPASGAPFPNFTSDLALPFNQNSFNIAVPQFGQPVNVANFGFAILSDLEAYLLVNASQGDRRSNVLQAPKVTMFNGQAASVFDQTQQPFLISVIPVVGDFAAAYQPVITVLSQGQALTVQAVVSADRRFVRLTVVPFFSTIGDVEEFKFTGSSSSNTSTKKETSTGGTSGDSTSTTDDEISSSDGVTIQLPSFSFVSVSTTVSVPDGGTVLLGGIKRLSEGRNEFGVPILSKLPYINRLFKNVGIGRDTSSLMMMVTPRIIIQEEEEERLGIPPSTP